MSEEDFFWLEQFENLYLTHNQKRALIFAREAGAVDNPTYRQLNGCDIMRASTELRQMRDQGLVEIKGKGRATYYVPGPLMNEDAEFLVSAPPKNNSAPVSTPARDHILNKLPEKLKLEILNLGVKIHDPEKIKTIIQQVCFLKKTGLQEIAILLARQPKYILRKFIQPMMEEGKIGYTILDMPNHPNQAYKAVEQKT